LLAVPLRDIIQPANIAYTQTLGNMLKEPTHIQAHLVFADTQANAEKPKELEFSQRSTKEI